MKRYLLAAFTCLFITTLQAQVTDQQSTGFFVFGQFNEEDKTAVIFGDVCNLRKAPKADGEVVGKLTIGTRVQILSVSKEKHTINGIDAPWCKIKSGTLEGYVWAGVLTNNLVKLTDGKSMVWGLTDMMKGADQKVFSTKISIRIFQNGVITHKTDFTSDRDVSNPTFGELTVSPSPQLSKVDAVVSFVNPVEACLEVASTSEFFYTGGKLLLVGRGRHISDADVFHQSTYYQFPFIGEQDCNTYIPLENTFYKIEELWERDAECDIVESRKVKLYKWDGQKFSKASCDEQ